MTLYQWLAIFSVPALLVAVVKFLLAQIKGIRLGVQALLRAQMIADYNKYSEQEYAPIYARENFENCWAQYHALGANGVMDDLHNKFLQLPTEKPVKKEGTRNVK